MGNARPANRRPLLLPRLHETLQKWTTSSRAGGIGLRAHGHWMEVERLAIQFDGAACQKALWRRSRAEVYYIARPVAYAAGLALGKQEVQYLHAPQTTARVGYVINQKAASTWFVSTLCFKEPGAVGSTYLNVTDKLFAESGAHNCSHRLLHTDKAPEWKPDDAIFSFVRSPLEMALSAYLEVSRRADGMSASKGVHAAYRNMSCASLSSSTDRFEAYLGDLEAGRPLGGEAVHSFPQAFKIYFPRPTARSRRFSAIGKLENLSDHLGQMRALFFTSELGGSSLAQFQHSGRADARGKGSTRHEGSQCSHIDWQRQSLLLRLCRVYLADFHCFNYSMPAECQEMSIQ